MHFNNYIYLRDLEIGRDKGFFTENLAYDFSRKEQHKDCDGAVFEFFIEIKILVITGWFELQTSYMQCSYLIY